MADLCPQCPKERPESARKLHRIHDHVYKCYQGHWFKKKDGKFSPYNPNKTDLQ
jgi:hypothetical protein